MRSNLAGKFVLSILSRAERSASWAARHAGVTPIAMCERLRGKNSSVSTERLLVAARDAGASDDELRTIVAMDAIDRGALPLDKRTTPEEVKIMWAALETTRLGTSEAKS